MLGTTYPAETGKYRVALTLYVRFVLNNKGIGTNTCHISERGLAFIFDVSHCFDPMRCPPRHRQIGRCFYA